jgi:predicted RNA methylase
MVKWVFQRVVKPAQLALREEMSLRIDRSLGVQTTDEVLANLVGADIKVFRTTQRALGWTGVWRLLRHLNLKPGDVFLDIGCGGGRVICGAARTGATRVIGLDIDPRMADLARANVGGLRGRRGAFEVLAADATSYRVPDDVNEVFLYNPFVGEVFSKTLKRLIESADRAPRRIRLAYANPAEHELVMATKRFVPSGAMMLGWRPKESWARQLRVQFYDLTPN